jgi:hypothetical protein
MLYFLHDSVIYSTAVVNRTIYLFCLISCVTICNNFYRDRLLSLFPWEPPLICHIWLFQTEKCFCLRLWKYNLRWVYIFCHCILWHGGGQKEIVPFVNQRIVCRTWYLQWHFFQCIFRLLRLHNVILHFYHTIFLTLQIKWCPLL